MKKAMAAKLKRFLEKNGLIDSNSEADIDGRTGQFFYGPTRYGGDGADDMQSRLNALKKDTVVDEEPMESVPTPSLPNVPDNNPLEAEKLRQQGKRLAYANDEVKRLARDYAGILDRVLPDAPRGALATPKPLTPGGSVPTTAFDKDAIVSDTAEERIAQYPPVDEASLFGRFEAAGPFDVQPLPRELLDDAYFNKPEQVVSVRTLGRRILMPGSGEKTILVTLDGVVYKIAASEIMSKTTLNAFAEHIRTKCGGFACVLIDRFTKLAVKIVSAGEAEALAEVNLLRTAAAFDVSPNLVFDVMRLALSGQARPYLSCFTMEAYEGTLQNLLLGPSGKAVAIVTGLNKLVAATLRMTKFAHGDLHPDNIVYREWLGEYTFKIIDWGSPVYDATNAGFVSAFQWLCYAQALVPAFKNRRADLLSRSVCNRVMVYAMSEQSEAGEAWFNSMRILADLYAKKFEKTVRVYSAGIGFYVDALPLGELPCGAYPLD